MTLEIGITLGVIVCALVLFASEKVRVDLVALLVLLTLALTQLVSPEEAFSGFSNPAVITVWAVYIVSGGLLRTGVADTLGERIIRLAGASEPRLIAVIMLTAGLISAFMNNIGATAVCIPAVVGISRLTQVPLSRLLIPLAFASLMGGNMTLIGTPPNILASGLLAQRGLPTFAFFDFLPTGAIVLTVGILYFVTIGRNLLPRRANVEERSVANLRAYISEVRVAADSPLAGQSLLKSRLGAEYDLTVIAIVREGQVRRVIHPETRLLVGDVLLVEASVEKLMRAREELGLVIEAAQKFDRADINVEQVHLVEATLAPRSPIVDRTLREIRFRDRYSFTALAIWRQGEIITERLSDVRLRFGDALLLQGPRHRLQTLQEGNEFLVLEPVRIERRRKNKAKYALGALALVLALTSILGFHISLAMVIGAVAMLLTGCLTMDEAYQSIDWRSIFLIAGMLPLGIAMESTGTARFLAGGIANATGSFGPLAVLMGIYLLATFLTQPMSNAAATVLIVPIAIDIALGMNADPRAFVLAVVIGTSTSFLTPVGHQANMLVFGLGGYRFFDYTRAGALLTLLVLVATILFLPILWPLYP